MEDKKRVDIKLDDDLDKDDGFEELDKLLNSGFEDPSAETEDVDDSRSPVERILKKTAKVAGEELSNIGKVAEKVSEAIMDNLPDSIRVYVDTGKEIADKVDESVTKVTDTGRQIGYGLLGKLEEALPDNKFKEKVHKLKEAIKPEERTTYYVREETDEEKALKQVTSLLGEQLEHNKFLEQEKLKLEQLSLKTNTDYLREQTLALNVLRDYTLNVVNKYHRKSLELQIRQLIVTDKLYTLLNKDIPIMSKQLEAIVKNTSIPDMVKLNTGEYLKEKFRQSMVTKGLDILKSNQLVKVIKEKAESKLTDVLGSVLGNADQIQSMLEGGMDVEGMDKTEMMLSMALDSVIGKVTNKSLGFLKNRLKKSKYAGDIAQELTKLETDPKRALIEIADKLEKKGGKAAFLANMARSISDSMTDSVGGGSLMEGGLNEPSYLDNKMKKSVTVVIPTLLSKILAEVVAIRKGEKTRGEELVYDYEANKFTTTGRLKRELIKTQIDTAKSIKTGISTKLGEFFKTLDPHGVLSKKDKEEIAKVLIPYLLNGGSTDIRYILQDGLDQQLKGSVAGKFKKLVTKIIKSKKVEDAVRITDISGILKDIKAEAIQRSENVSKHIEKLNKLGRADIAGEMGLLDRNDYSKLSGEHLIKSLSKYTDREINKHGIDITEVPEATEEHKEGFLSKVGKKIKEKTKQGIKDIKDTEAFKDLSSKIDELTERENILKSVDELKSNISKTVKDAVDKTLNKVDEIKLRHKISKVDKWSTAKPENFRMFKEGGYTGEGHPDEVAGIVHKDEYVVNKQKLSKLESITKKLTSLFTKEKKQTDDKVNRENAVDKLISTTQKLVSDIDLNLIKGKVSEFRFKPLNINTSGLETGVKNAINKVKASEAMTKLKHNLRDIKKMIADGSIDTIIKSQLANIPLPKNKEEAIGIYKKVLNAIDPTGKLFTEMTKNSKLLDKLNKLHIEAIAEQQDKLLKESGKTEGDVTTAGDIENMSFKDKVFKKFEDFKKNILEKTKKGALGVLSRSVKGFKKGLAPIKDDFMELIHDEYGNVKIPSIKKTVKFLGKTYVNTAKATGYATRELYGGAFSGVKGAVKGVWNKYVKNKSIAYALEKAPLPDEIKKEIAAGRLGFEDALDHLEGKDREVYAKWLEAKNKAKSKIGKAISLTKGIGKAYVGSAKIFGKKYKEGVDKAVDTAKTVGSGVVDTALHGKTIKDIISFNKKDREEHRAKNKEERDKKLEEVVKTTEDKVSKVEEKTDKIYSAVEKISSATKPKAKKDSFMDRDGDGDRDGNWKDRLKKLYSHKKKDDDKESKTILEKAKDASKWSWLIAPLMLLAGKIKSIFSGGLKWLVKETGKLIWKPFKWLGGKIIGGLEKLGGSIIKGVTNTIGKIGDLINKIPGVSKVKEVAGKAIDWAKDKAGKLVSGAKNLASKAWGKITGLFKSKTALKAEEKVAEKVVKKKIKAGAIKVFLHKLKKILIEKLGAKAAVKFLGKIAARFVPFAGWAMLAYDAVKVAWYMFHDGLSFKSAVSKQILGFDIFAKDEPAVDPDTGEPIKPDIPEDEIKKQEKKIINTDTKLKKDLKQDAKKKTSDLHKAVGTGATTAITTDIPGTVQSNDTKTTKPTTSSKLPKVKNLQDAVNKIKVPISNKAALVNELIHHEGMVLHKYKDSLGYETIGVGHLLDKRRGGVPLKEVLGYDKDQLTPQEAVELLAYDVNRISKKLYSKFPWLKDQPEEVQRHMIDMAFNLGTYGLAKFNRTLKLIKEGKYKEAGINLTKTKWYRQVGRRAKEIVNDFIALGDRVRGYFSGKKDDMNNQPPTSSAAMASYAMDTKAEAQQATAKATAKANQLATAPAPTIPSYGSGMEINSDALSTTNDILTKSLGVQQDMLHVMQQLLKVNMAMFKVTVDGKDMSEKDKEKLTKQVNDKKHTRVEEPPVKPALSYSHYKI